jgi:hypothetical protein
VLAGSALVQGIRHFADEFEQQAGRIEDTAGSLGLSTDELQELNYAADQGGASAEQMTSALAKLERNAVAAASGSGGAADAFRTLGIQLRDGSGQTRSAGDLMDDLAVNMSRIEDPARRTALAQQLLGTSGRRLLTVLHDGEGGLAAWRAEFAQLGGGISQDAIAAAGRYGDALNRWKVASDSLRAQIATQLLPMLADMVTWVTRGVAGFVRIARESHVVRAAMLVLGGAGALAGARMFAAWARVLMPFARLAAGIAILILLVDDVITLFNGGDSVIGRFIDRMAGVGASQRFVRAVQDAWVGMQMAARDVVAYLGEAWAGMQLAASSAAIAIGEFFDGLWRGLGAGAQRALTAIGEAIMSVIRPISNFVSRVGGAIGGAFSGLTSDWRMILGTPTAAPAAAAPASGAGTRSVLASGAPAAPRAATTTVVRAPTTINVSGAGDPAAVAHAVVQAAEPARRGRGRRRAPTPRAGGLGDAADRMDPARRHAAVAGV